VARIRIGTEGWTICTGEDCRDCVPVRSLENHSAAMSWLMRSKSDPQAMLALRRLAPEVGYRAIGHAHDDELLDQIAWAIHYGWIHVCRRVGSKGDSPGATAPPPPPQEDVVAATQRRPRKTWVEFKVVDMEGNPATGQHYLVMLPDGSLHEGNLDRSGMVRFDDIDPDNSVFTLPDLDREAWERVG